MDPSTTSPLIPQLLIRSAVPFYSTPDFPLQCKHQEAGPYIKARETERDEVQSPAACEHFLGCSFFSDITWVYSCDHLSNGGVFRFGEESHLSGDRVVCGSTTFTQAVRFQSAILSSRWGCFWVHICRRKEWNHNTETELLCFSDLWFPGLRGHGEAHEWEWLSLVHMLLFNNFISSGTNLGRNRNSI